MDSRSSSVSLHQACRSLQLGDCDASLAGGVNTISSPQVSLTRQAAGLSVQLTITDVHGTWPCSLPESTRQLQAL